MKSQLALSFRKGSAGFKKNPSTELLPKKLRCVFCEISVRNFQKENPKASDKRVSKPFERKHGLKKTKCFPLCSPLIKELPADRMVEVSWWCSNGHFVVKEKFGLYTRIVTQPKFCQEPKCFYQIRKGKSFYCHKHRNSKEGKY